MRQGNCAEVDYGMRRGQGATPAAFYLGLCRLRCILSPASNPSHPRFWRFSWIKLTSIPPSPLHVKGSFSRRLLQAGRSSLLQRRIELDAEVLCRYDRSRRNHSLLSQRKLVSDADVVVATPAAGWPFFFAAMKNRIGRGTRCCHGHCRQAILLCCYENWKRTRKTLLLRQLQSGHSSLLQRRLELDAEARCRDGRSRRNHTAILKFTPSNQESLHAVWHFRAKACSDSKVWP